MIQLLQWVGQITRPVHQRRSLRMLPPEVRDLVEEFLLRDEAFLVEQFDQRRSLPHIGEGQLVEGHKGVGIEVVGHLYYRLKIFSNFLCLMYSRKVLFRTSARPSRRPTMSSKFLSS